MADSLGNHTVNTLHSFPVVFVEFDKEDVNFHDFRQNILNPARCCAFFMYTLFFWKSRQYGEILDLPVENVVKNVIIQVICVWIEHFTHVFDDIFDSKSKISPFWFDFQKKNVYMKNEEQRAGFKIFWRKS